MLSGKIMQEELLCCSVSDEKAAPRLQHFESFHFDDLFDEAPLHSICLSIVSSTTVKRRNVIAVNINRSRY